MANDLVRPKHLWCRQEVLSRPSPVPRSPGVYGWYFQGLDAIASSACINCGDFWLLYTGISPSAPPRNGRSPSSQSLLHRVRYHYQGNAEGSTLRLTLGCLLANKLGIELRRVGSGKRFTFSTGETRLSEWMGDNARVAWHVCEEPWKLEEELIASLDLPLNLDQNRRHGFHPVLSRIRHEAKAKARELPILPR
ncbi:MAG: hypothetical protein JWQ87_963 [Candidatus Sulfotelmatobacter sp.]|nr:hypothetical protein [Candidatus Sulfotelmatobacter sp.]